MTEANKTGGAPRANAAARYGQLYRTGWYGDPGVFVPVEIARQLERELNEALLKLEKYQR